MALSELAQIPVALISLLPSIVYALSYAIGGRENAPVFHGHYWRRIVAPLSFSLCLLSLTWVFKPSNLSWITLCSPLTYLAVHWLAGYGGSSLEEKLRGRVWTGVLIGLACLPIAIYTGSWTLFSFQTFLSCLSHVVLGILNPLPASKEEFLLSFLTVIFVPFMMI